MLLGFFSCSVKNTPKKWFSPLCLAAALVYTCIARIQITEQKVQEVPEMFCNHLPFRFHSTGPVQLEVLWMCITGALQQWANAVPSPSAPWKPFFLKMLEKSGAVKTGVTLVTHQDRRSADAARRFENQAHRSVQLVSQGQPMAHHPAFPARRRHIGR
jgi:hypothetical protein